eukprot:INCI17795.2.p1 GENE.INCI17795.2~~INCI17795.2.p1  ORF type:complete len:170 (+),score=19.58 INCI17795.2:82-591(+)
MRCSSSTLVVLLVTLAGTVGRARAVPSLKTCTAQAGSDDLGVPTLGGDGFYAMSVDWTEEASVDDGFFTVDSGSSTISVQVPASAFGFFAIVSSGSITVPSHSSTCSAGCERLVCVENGGTIPLSILDNDLATCRNIRLVVGYASGFHSGNTYVHAPLFQFVVAEATLS